MSWVRWGRVTKRSKAHGSGRVTTSDKLVTRGSGRYEPQVVCSDSRIRPMGPDLHKLPSVCPKICLLPKLNTSLVSYLSIQT